MQNQQNISLMRPSEVLKEAFLKWLEGAHLEGAYLFWPKQQVSEDFSKFVHEQLDKEIMCPIANVPESVFWVIQDGQMIGRTSIRHYLNDKLEKRGGHIGYQVSQRFRGKGLAKGILELALLEAQRIGLSKVLLTTDKSNVASQKVIAANNGVLDSERSTEDHLYYWILLSR